MLLEKEKIGINSRKCSFKFCSLEREDIIPADEPYPSYQRQAKSLTEANKVNTNLKSVNAQLLQQVLKSLDRAFADMNKKKLGFPRFKKKYRRRSSVYPQLGKNVIQHNYINLPQVGSVKFIKSRKILEGFQVKQARVIRKASGYFVLFCLQLDVNVAQPFPSGHSLGIDLGFDKFVATSDGVEDNRPKFLKTLQRKLKLLQRKLKNKKKGSNNRHKLNRKIARLHQHISDTRKDDHFKLAHPLCDGTGMIFAEDIDFRTWQRGMLSKHSADAGFGQFVGILQWVCWKRDVYFAKVDKDGTSQECSKCGTHTGKKTLSMRVHHCPECGYTNSRDVVSAKVIRDRGLSAVGTPVDIKQCDSFPVKSLQFP